MSRSLLFTIALMLFACTPPPDSGPAEGGRSTDVADDLAPDTTTHDPIGNWVLAGFHDSIIANKEIGRYRLPIPVWTALLLRVDSTMVTCNGTLLSQTRRFPRIGNDTLLELNEYGQQTFVFDAKHDRIQVLFRNQKDLKESAMEYRRLSANEGHLLTGIDARHQDSLFMFAANYRKHLTHLLFTGQYEPLSAGQYAFQIDGRGHISGHPNWNVFWFHAYFGTLHPFTDDVDGLVFTDTSKTWPDNTFPFNWNFVGDTLLLRAMTTNGDSYYLSKDELRFLKRP